MRDLRVLIFQQRGWALQIGHFLAQRLQEEGCRLAALTFKRSTHEFVLRQSEVEYELVLSNDEIMDAPGRYLAGDSPSLETVCRDLGIPSIWPLVGSLRNHVRSYEDKYYYGFKQSVPDEAIVEYVLAAHKSIREIFTRFRPDVIVTPNFVSLPHIMFNLYARRQGVPMLGVTDAKVRGIFVFSESYQDDRGPFIDRIDELHAGLAETSHRGEARGYIEEFRGRINQPAPAAARPGRKGVRTRLRNHLRPWYQVLRWYVDRPRNVLQTTGITLDYRPPKIILRDHYSRRRYLRYMESFRYVPLESVERFVYFPLQFQPEAVIDVMAPYYNNQLETARQVAMALPGDYTLVVKEHPAMVGYRTPSYIEKVARTPNVKLVDHRTPSDEVLARAAMVVSPNSTTLFEAAFYRKPAIQLGNLGSTLRLPNVVRHTDMTTLSSRISEVLRMNLDTPEYERRLENFIAAAFDVGFDFDYIGVWEQGRSADMEELWKLYHDAIVRAVGTRSGTEPAAAVGALMPDPGSTDECE